MSRAIQKLTAFTALILAACDVPTPPGADPPDRPAMAPEYSYSEPVTYPLHAYGTASDAWPYMTPVTGVYVEIRAANQTPQPSDGQRVCPNDQVVGRNAHLRMTHNGDELDLDFRGPFTFLRHVSTSGSPWPTALYRFPNNTYSRDNRYYAPGGGNVLLACDGRYVLNNWAVRLWTGHLYGKLYNGPLVWVGSVSTGPCRPGDDPVYMTSYDPYVSDPEGEAAAADCSDTPGGGGSSTPGMSFPETCSTLGGTLYYDYVCLQVWNAAAGQYESVWCGTAAICET